MTSAIRNGILPFVARLIEFTPNDDGFDEAALSHAEAWMAQHRRDYKLADPLLYMAEGKWVIHLTGVALWHGDQQAENLELLQQRGALRQKAFVDRASRGGVEAATPDQVPPEQAGPRIRR
jgi:hypothetical protein